MPSNQRSRFARAVHVLLYGVRWVLFMVLLYLRGLAFFVLEGVGGLAGFCFVFALLFLRGTEYSFLVWLFGGLSFGSFVLRFVYDIVLLRLSPTDAGLIL